MPFPFPVRRHTLVFRIIHTHLSDMPLKSTVKGGQPSSASPDFLEPGILLGPTAPMITPGFNEVKIPGYRYGCLPPPDLSFCGSTSERKFLEINDTREVTLPSLNSLLPRPLQERFSSNHERPRGVLSHIVEFSKSGEPPKAEARAAPYHRGHANEGCHHSEVHRSVESAKLRRTTRGFLRPKRSTRRRIQV